MEGNVETAAKWLGASMILASGILVGGLRWVLSSRESDQPARTIPFQAIEPRPTVQASPVPGDLEELTRSFHGLGPEANALPSSADRPRSLFADPTPRPTQGNTSP
ncbi:hypothetical protein Sinac_7562 [Singulisphaera acidiphila DSM 18658]|uniref:Uncharacterized protein n=1 Tax=Singulisphaera acidiphila (strain ATCC BAA-1392 / DSM 18658 / VKM B-2454 / MOB10) TaxID=886293 RepID=L0DRG7_SINAD|nr:hypothetical protein Sinac_7562 [Singulisphaera acidiphila DSM 18658]